MREEEVKLRHALKKFSKTLYILNTQLQEAYSLSKTLEEFKTLFEEIEGLLREHPELKIFVEDIVKDEDILPVFKETRARFNALLDLMNSHAPTMDSADVFMEQYRTYRYLFVPEDDMLLDLIERIFGADTAYIRLSIVPEDFADFVKKEGLELRGRFTIVVAPDKLHKVAKILLERYSETGLVIEDERGQYRLTWKPDLGIVRIDAPKEKVPLIDSIGKAVGASVLDA